MAELSNSRLDECIGLWRKSEPVPDFEFVEALRIATELKGARERIADLEQAIRDMLDSGPTEWGDVCRAARRVGFEEVSRG